MAKKASPGSSRLPSDFLDRTDHTKFSCPVFESILRKGIAPYISQWDSHEVIINRNQAASDLRRRERLLDQLEVFDEEGEEVGAAIRGQRVVRNDCGMAEHLQEPPT